MRIGIKSAMNLTADKINCFSMHSLEGRGDTLYLLQGKMHPSDFQPHLRELILIDRFSDFCQIFDLPPET
jgi:hypothetical protein